ncbi:MAG: DUF374 domain-containing protein [candidate division WOR-3 bacterium]
MLKKLRQTLLIHAAPPLVFIFLILLRLTLRIRHAEKEQVLGLLKAGTGMIACFWHGRLLMMPFAHRRRVKVLISRHRDGEFIARVIRFFGLGAVRGSAGKEGQVSSFREMLNAIKQGWIIAITPDGPKGPRYKIKEGLIELARMSGRPIVPLTFGASKKKRSILGISSSSPILFPKLSFCGVSLFT